jgi:hypothetical protein
MHRCPTVRMPTEYTVEPKFMGMESPDPGRTIPILRMISAKTTGPVHSCPSLVHVP